MRRSSTTLASAAATLLLSQLSARHHHFAEATPFLLLNSARPKCVEVKATAETLLYVDYQAPDLVTLDDEEPDEEPPKEDTQKTPPDGQPDGSEKSPEEARAEAQKGGDNGNNKDQQKFGSGHDRLWYEKNKARLEAMRKMKGKAITDMVIMANEKGDTVGAARRRWRQRQQDGLGRQPKPLTRIREDVNAVNGTVRVETTQDGTVEICVQSLSASPSAPSLVTLSIREDMDQKREKEAERTDRRNLGVMESTLRGLIRRTDLILKNADFAKDQEHDFHETTIAMNRATKYWPMLHCAILCITGVTMARHMTSFLKNHHIY